MTRLPTFVLVSLGYLVGCAEAMNGEAAGRVSLECVGLIVTAFLFYLAFRSVHGVKRNSSERGRRW